MSISGFNAQTRGVDSTHAANDALSSARILALLTRNTVCVSGDIDHLLDHQGRWARLGNCHSWMTKITGVGCSSTALVGAFCAIQPDFWRATTWAMAFLGVAGEIAAEKAQSYGLGVGGMAVKLFDELQLMD